MSKKKGFKNLAAFALAATLVAATLLSAAGVSASQRAKRASASVNPKTLAVREATAEVLRETSELRKLPILRQVRSGAQSREEIEKMLVRNLDESAKPEQLRATEITLHKLGLASADFRVRSFIIKLLTEQVAGYYDPKTREFYLADWIDLDGQRPVMAHELTHALQDQHFNLRRFEKWPKHDSDAELAAHALVEGDASLVMEQYLANNPIRLFSFIKSMVLGGSGSTEQFDKAPRVLRETLMFPYLQGKTFASAAFKRGGWDEVSATYKKLPKSSEQILHPEKYFANDDPRKVALRDISAALGKGWKMADNDVQGEWGYYLLLDEFLKSGDESKKAAEGWGGDRYALFTGPTDADALVAQKTVWDTEADAREFFDAYVKRTTMRYGAEPADASAQGTRRWKTKEGDVLVEQSGASVIVIEGMPDGIDAKSLLKML